MKNLTFIAFLLFIINSSIAQEPWFASLENKAEKVDFPILIDSSYIDNAFIKMTSGDRTLRIDDLKILCPGYDTLTNNRDFFMLNQFIFIDSLKSASMNTTSFIKVLILSISLLLIIVGVFL